MENPSIAPKQAPTVPMAVARARSWAPNHCVTSLIIALTIHGYVIDIIAWGIKISVKFSFPFSWASSTKYLAQVPKIIIIATILRVTEMPNFSRA